jgi:Tfp pilus assembly protein PilF
MIEQSRLAPASTSRAGFRFRTVVFGTAMLLAVVITGAAKAQMTTQMIIGDAVSEIGNKYPEVDDAIKRFINGDVTGARLVLEAAKKKDPNLPPVDLLLAKMFILGNNANGGRAFLEKAALDNPTDPEPYLILADTAVQQGRIIEASALYEQGLALASKFSGNAKRKRNFEIRSRIGRAMVSQQRKDWTTAAADLKALLETDPENALGHLRLGQVLFMQKQFRPGYDEFVAAKKADKNLPEPYLTAALMYDQLKMPSETQQAFDRAIAANPKDANTLTQYAQWLIKSGSVDKAEKVLADARKGNEDNLNLLILSGIAARMLKKTKEAENFFVQAVGIAPANGDVINQLALLLIEQPGQPEKNRAFQFAAMSAQLNNQSPDAQITYAWVLFQLGRTNDADAALRNGAQRGNLSPDSSYLVAKMFVASNKVDLAKAMLKDALANESPGIFVFRKDAEALLDSLK